SSSAADERYHIEEPVLLLTWRPEVQVTRMCLYTVPVGVARVAGKTGADGEEEVRRNGKACEATGANEVTVVANLDSVVAPFGIGVPGKTVIDDIVLIGRILPVRVLQVPPVNVIGTVVIKEDFASGCKTRAGRVARGRTHMIPRSPGEG